VSVWIARHSNHPTNRQKKNKRKRVKSIVIIREETRRKGVFIVRNRGKKLSRLFKCIKNANFHPKNP
jgi:translation initiation factor 1 (eIF-1/SUI1)